MKAILFAITLLTTHFGFSQSDNSLQASISNPEDFVVISDVDNNEMSIFLSYAGKQMNHCGIKFRTHLFAIGAQVLSDIIEVDGGQPEKIVDGKLIVPVTDPNATAFGEFFTIKTKSGKTLREEFRAIDVGMKVDVIAELMTCEGF